MYYEESSLLINQSPLDKNSLKKIDRELAHAYAPDGYGYIELSLLCNNIRLAEAEVRRLLDHYESVGCIHSYIQVTCSCGATYDPGDEECIDCRLPVGEASANGITCYRVSKQPTKPAFRPDSPPVAPNVFISYCHADTSTLAADIYYSLQDEGHSVFLDDGKIPVGADAEQSYLEAACTAQYFIALVSSNYFKSTFCKREIAHSARCGNRLIRINVPPIPSAPNDMPWIDNPNWNRQQGHASGLDSALEESLLSVIEIQPSAPNADLRKQACQFLMEQLSVGELERLWNRLPWMIDFSPVNARHQNIGQILRETTEQRLSLLCNALSP